MHIHCTCNESRSETCTTYSSRSVLHPLQSYRHQNVLMIVDEIMLLYLEANIITIVSSLKIELLNYLMVS